MLNIPVLFFFFLHLFIVSKGKQFDYASIHKTYMDDLFIIIIYCFLKHIITNCKRYCKKWNKDVKSFECHVLTIKFGMKLDELPDLSWMTFRTV